MEWDKIKMAQQFLAHANGLHPEEAMDQDEACRLLALQDLYYECYISSFSREKLLEALDSALAGKIVIPKDVNEKKYREAYKAEAEKIRLKYQK
jgi:DNA-binding NarL/FixJ family response regulator